MTYIEIRSSQVAIAKWMEKVAAEIWDELLYGNSESGMPEGMKKMFRDNHIEHDKVFRIQWAEPEYKKAEIAQIKIEPSA